MPGWVAVGRADLFAFGTGRHSDSCAIGSIPLVTLRNAQVRRISWVRGVRPVGGGVSGLLMTPLLAGHHYGWSNPSFCRRLGTQRAPDEAPSVRPQSRGSLDLGLPKLDVLLGDRVVFLLHQLVGHGARILLGHVIETGIGGRYQLHFDRGRLGHIGILAK